MNRRESACFGQIRSMKVSAINLVISMYRRLVADDSFGAEGRRQSPLPIEEPRVRAQTVGRVFVQWQGDGPDVPWQFLLVLKVANAISDAKVGVPVSVLHPTLFGTVATFRPFHLKRVMRGQHPCLVDWRIGLRRAPENRRS